MAPWMRQLGQPARSSWTRHAFGTLCPCASHSVPSTLKNTLQALRHSLSRTHTNYFFEACPSSRLAPLYSRSTLEMEKYTYTVRHLGSSLGSRPTTHTPALLPAHPHTRVPSYITTSHSRKQTPRSSIDNDRYHRSDESKAAATESPLM